MTNDFTVLSGKAYTEIDVLACVLAYTDLLKLEGKNARGFLTGPLNRTITADIKKWPLIYEVKLPQEISDQLVVVDMSDINYMSGYIPESNVVEIYDHHFGFEKYWKEKLGESAKIEPVGSCATLIFEEYLNRKLTPSTLNANLMYTAIISNNLNMFSSVTTSRDIVALEKLKSQTDLPKNWIEKYFTDQEVDIFYDPVKAIMEDTKIVDNLVITQLELWNSKKFIENYLADAEKGLESFSNPRWILTSPSISEGKNYLYCKNNEVKDLFEKIFDVKFHNHIAQTSKLYLRKEILKKLKENPR